LEACLAEEKKIPDFSLNKAYDNSLHPDLHDKILFYLHDEKTLHERGKAFEVKQVREVAKHILSGLDYWYKSSWPSASSKSTIPAPPVKTEISEVLNAITMMGQNLQMAMTAQMTSHPGPQTFQNAPARQANFQRQDQPCPGTAGTQCYMCHETAHFLSSCPILAEYTQLRKVSRNMQNLLILGNGDPIPNDPMNHLWAAQVDNFYSRNPHLLKDPPLHMQANFAANLLEVHRKSPLREEKSSLFTHLDSINEEDEELSSLGGETEEDKLQLDRYIEVLQIKRKEMDLVKKSPDLPTSTPVRPMDAPLAKKTYSAPKTQVPSAKPLPSTPTSVNPAPQSRYMAPIESKVNASDVIGWILSEKVCLSVEELLALAPEVRRHFKEATTMKRLPALPAEAQSKAAHHVATFSMDKHHKHFSAEPALPLWMIEVTLDHTVMVTGIINSGFQVIIIHKDIWERLGMPMKHEQVMFMELDNGQSNATMGTIPSICFSI